MSEEWMFASRNPLPDKFVPAWQTKGNDPTGFSISAVSAHSGVSQFGQGMRYKAIIYVEQMPIKGEKKYTPAALGNLEQAYLYLKEEIENTDVIEFGCMPNPYDIDADPKVKTIEYTDLVQDDLILEVAEVLRVENSHYWEMQYQL